MARHVGTNLSAHLGGGSAPRADPAAVSALDAALHGGTAPQVIHLFPRASSSDSDSDSDSDLPSLPPPALPPARAASRHRHHHHHHDRHRHRHRPDLPRPRDARPLDGEREPPNLPAYAAPAFGGAPYASHAPAPHARPRSVPLSSRSRSARTESPPRHPTSRSLPASPAQSSSSSGSSGSSASARPALLCTVLPVRRSFELRERVASDGSRKFRVRDAASGAKLFAVGRGEAGPCVTCASGAVLWSVLPYSSSSSSSSSSASASAASAGGESKRARILHKNGSAFYVVLAAHRWAPRIERRAYGHVHALPHVRRKPELALEVFADSLGKRFQVLGRDGSDGAPHAVATAKRSTRLQKLADARVREVAVWNVEIEPNVDSAMVAAMLFVLNEWEVRPPALA